jgi:type II secretory pathway component PulK
MGLVSDKGDSRGVMLITVMSVFWVFAVIAVGLRIWARHITRASYVLNDYAIFIAIV